MINLKEIPKYEIPGRDLHQKEIDKLPWKEYENFALVNKETKHMYLVSDSLKSLVDFFEHYKEKTPFLKKLQFVERNR